MMISANYRLWIRVDLVSQSVSVVLSYLSIWIDSKLVCMDSSAVHWSILMSSSDKVY